MEKKQANTGPKLKVDVSEQEQQTAKSIKKDLKSLLETIDDALPIIYDLKYAILKDHPSQEDLASKYKGRFLRYKRKIVDAFNAILLQVQKVLEEFDTILDPEMAKLRRITVSEFDDMSDVIEYILQLLNNPQRDGFTKKLEGFVSQLEKRRNNINDIIDSQIFSHIDVDILGKLKISEMKTRIYKRTRKIRNAGVKNDY